MKNWLIKILSALPINDILEILFSILGNFVKSTENKFDDHALEIIHIIIAESFRSDPKK